ncbi:hypothetical protein L6452_31479 [Arctium lappa]|uniref:Uncharacterized protein n=1 Tax=Arctium lappa TaxID=4217 RepID=A0ACB8Z2A1_ARCLA|nr:hypothetical protein L6452_31479 [Arctium lappa]
MSQKYGPIFSLRLGTKLHVVVNTMDLVKVVARDLDHTFSNRDAPLTALTITYGGLDVAFSSQKHWRDMRKILVSRVLSNANLDASRSFRTNGVRKTVKDVYGRIGTEININKIAYDTEINVVTNMLWGCSQGKNDDDSSSQVGDGFQEIAYKIMELLAAPNISDFIPMLSRFDLQGRQRDMKKLKEHIDRIFEKVIRERIDANSRKMEKDERKDFLQILLDEKDDPTSSIDINQIKALLVDVMIGTTDTTSTMVELVMAEILYNPRVMTKIREELTDVVGMNNIVEESHLSKLTYLDAVIKETFRLLPAVPLLIHRCPDESCTVGGYTIPKAPLGEKMLMNLVASLLHSFDWSLTKDEDFDLSQVFGIVMKKRKPLKAIPSPRLLDARLYL